MSTEAEPKVQRFSVQAAAAYLGLNPATVYRLCNARKIRHKRIGVGGGRIVFDRADLDAYLSSAVVEVGELKPMDQQGALKHLRLPGA